MRNRPTRCTGWKISKLCTPWLWTGNGSPGSSRPLINIFTTHEATVYVFMFAFYDTLRRAYNCDLTGTGLLNLDKA